MPLTEEVRELLLPADEPLSDGLSYLTPALRALAAEWSAHGALAYVEGESHGGTGTQQAVIWEGRAVVWGPRRTADNLADAADGEFAHTPDPRDYAVNAALRELGVVRGDAVDEFAALGLHLKTWTEEWLPDL